MSDLYVDNATTPPWVKVYLDKATLPEVAVGLLRLFRCTTCVRTPGRVRMVNGEVVSDALGWTEGESSPCLDCVNGIRLPDEVIDALAKEYLLRTDRYENPEEVWRTKVPMSVRVAAIEYSTRIFLAGLVAALEAE